MQKKLYGCRRCNKIGYTSPCACSGDVYEFKTIGVDDIKEKPSIGNENVFDRIDRELAELRARHMILTVQNDTNEDRIKSLEESLKEWAIEIVKLGQRANYIDNNPPRGIEPLDTSLQHLYRKTAMLEDRIDEIESKEKIQPENVYDYPLYQELKQKCDKLLYFVKIIPNISMQEEVEARNKLLKDLGEEC